MSATTEASMFVGTKKKTQLIGAHEKYRFSNNIAGVADFSVSNLLPIDDVSLKIYIGGDRARVKGHRII